MGRVDLPGGTVTFVFTDVEGSTRLLDDLGTERYAEVLADHHRMCRDVWLAHGGIEVDTSGDAFFVAFARPSDALSAAAAAQEALASGPLRVRMGVHSGEVMLGETGYVGMEVHRAARIAAAGHGGQVLVSSATAALVKPDGLRDLGEHRFKDLAAAERVYQLGEGEFPALKSLYRSNLPVPTTRFIGRERERRDVVELLTHDEVRLLTLTGPGGTGKTRLALQAAAEASNLFRDGVFWVPLAALRDPSLVIPSLAQALDLREASGRELVDVTTDHLSRKRTLLLFDNAEHLLPAFAETVARLHAIGGPTILVTSRERLQLAGEQAYPVPELTPDEGVELFLARAAAAGVVLEPTSTVLELCAKLERLPLALELAASRTMLFGPEQLLERVSQRLDLLKGGRDSDPRHQTLRATIAWSYDLLSPQEKRLLRGLSVFSGGCTYEAAEAVCDTDPDTLQSLLEKSLVRRGDTDGRPRFWMLESIREFAAECREASDDGSDVQERHGRWYQELVRRAEPQLTGVDQHLWLDRLSDDHDNLRAALAYLERDRVAQLTMATSLWRFWQARNHLTEGRAWLVAPADIELVVGAEVAARLHVAASRLAWKQGDLARGRAHAEAAYEIAVRTGNVSLLALAAENLGNVVGITDLEPGRDRLAESVKHFRQAGDDLGLASALNNLAYIQLELGELEAAATSVEESIRLARFSGNAYGLGFALDTLGYIDLHRGSIDNAKLWLEEALLVFHDLGDSASVGDTLEGLGHCAEAAGETHKAAVLWAAGDALREQGGFEVPPLERALQEAARPRVEAQLGASAYASARQEGRAMSLETAVEVALGRLDLPS